jgi:hypothetical protein
VPIVAELITVPSLDLDVQMVGHLGTALHGTALDGMEGCVVFFVFFFFVFFSSLLFFPFFFFSLLLKHSCLLLQPP